MIGMLYVNNFRGFTDTYIPLERVNFFVGENSTGKTSILSLISLLGSYEFWTSSNFNTNDVQFGSFKDIISIQTKELKFFQIGFIIPVQNQPEVYQAVLMTFKEKDNSPLMTQFDYIGKSGQATVLFPGNQVKYKYSPIEIGLLNFKGVLEIFKSWTNESNKNNTNGYKIFPQWTIIINNNILFRIESVLQQILLDEVSEFYIPEFSDNIVWLAPIRSKPRRTYDEYKLDFNSEGNHTPYLIKKFLKSKKEAKAFRNFLAKFGQESNLFESLEIQNFGKEMASPFELRVVLNKIPLPLVNVGYGVTQALPVVIELFTRPKATSFAIQQPEVHLHPKAQAALGDVIFQLAETEEKIFFVETHSDYTIDRFRLNYRKNPSGVSAQVLFFDRTPTGNQVYPIDIMENGEYSEDQPDNFREFFIHEQLNLLGL